MKVVIEFPTSEKFVPAERCMNECPFAHYSEDWGKACNAIRFISLDLATCPIKEGKKVE